MNISFKIDEAAFNSFLFKWKRQMVAFDIGFLWFFGLILFSETIYGILALSIFTFGFMYFYWRIKVRWMRLQADWISRFIVFVEFNQEGVEIATAGLRAYAGMISKKPTVIVKSIFNIQVKAAEPSDLIGNKSIKKGYVVIVESQDYYLVEGFFRDFDLLVERLESNFMPG